MILTEKNGSVEGLIKHRKSKFDGEVEPELKNLADGNRRVKLQNYKFKGNPNKIVEMMQQDFNSIEFDRTMKQEWIDNSST